MAGKKYSDVYAVSNTAAITDTDLMVLQRADGNTYAFQTTTLKTYIQTVEEPPAVFVSNSTPFTVNSSHKVIFANTEFSNVNIVLPVSLPNGKQITVKNITPAVGTYYVNVTSDQSYRVEGYGTSTLGNTAFFKDFNAATWVNSNGYFYVISGW